MEIIVKTNDHSVSRSAAEIIARVIREKPNCVLGLATGSTPIGTYKELARMHKEEGLDFSKVVTFNLDEYLGIGLALDKSYKEDQSYARFMYEELFRHINIKPENTHVPNGLAKDPDTFCKAYEAAIQAAGGIDLQLLGIGGDGHVAFNEPGTLFDSRTHVQLLTEKTRQDNYKAFFQPAGIDWEHMPKQALTMGVGTILEAKEWLMIATGANKAEIVKQTLEGEVSPRVTASAIQIFTRKATVILDKKAAARLQYRR